MAGTVVFTTTQMTVGLIISILALVGSGVAFGRLTERQKGDHQILHDTLEALQAGMQKITETMEEMQRQYQKTREERVEWNYWRVIKDEQDAERDSSISALQEAHANHSTRIVVLEDRRTGLPDRRHPAD